MASKQTQPCPKCDRHITHNNLSRHVDACSGITTKKVRGVDYNPNHGYASGDRVAWNKGMKLGPNQSHSEYYAALRRSTSTEDIKSQAAIRKKVLEEQHHKCNKCGISEWMGQPLPMELDHRDGVRTNNTRSNLECLCPNCHSQTPTWRGRNRGS